MTQQNVKLDLGGTWGEVHLASALGVGTDAVGGLWKKLRKLYPDSRIQRLESLAATLAGQPNNDSVAVMEELSREYGISPMIIQPLIAYYATTHEQPEELKRDWKCYFWHCYD